VTAAAAFAASVAISRGVVVVLLLVGGTIGGLVVLGGVLWLLGTVFPLLRRK